MFDSIVLVVIDIISKILFEYLIELFYLFVYLKIEYCRQFAIDF
jgi:hypothetical protein